MDSKDVKPGRWYWSTVINKPIFVIEVFDDAAHVLCPEIRKYRKPEFYEWRNDLDDLSEIEQNPTELDY